MRKIIPYILVLLAALNLIWLFAFDYKIPDFINNTISNMFRPADIEEIAPDGEETGEEQQAEGATEQGDQEPGQEAAAAEPGAPAGTEGAGTENLQEETVPETAERTCQPTDGNMPNIRSGPGTNYDVIGMANTDDIMVVRGDAEAGWLPIRTKDGLEGYVFTDLVRVIESGE